MTGPTLETLAASMVERFPIAAIVLALDKASPGIRGAFAPIIDVNTSAAECFALADWFEGYHATVDVIRRQKMASILRRAATIATPPAAVVDAAIDWRWHYVFQTRMRMQDAGMDAATALKAAEDDADSLERAALTPPKGDAP